MMALHTSSGGLGSLRAGSQGREPSDKARRGLEILPRKVIASHLHRIASAFVGSLLAATSCARSAQAPTLQRKQRRGSETPPYIQADDSLTVRQPAGCYRASTG